MLRGSFFRGHSVYYYESDATITNIHRSLPHIMAGKQRYDAKKLRHCQSVTLRIYRTTRIKTKFHNAILVADRFAQLEPGRRPVQTC